MDVVNNVTHREPVDVENIFILRSMFYLVKPSETYYEYHEEVPNLTSESMKFYFAFFFLEQFIFLFKNGKFNGRLCDVVSSYSFLSCIELICCNSCHTVYVQRLEVKL